MRMSSWTPEIVRFMEDAEQYTTYSSDIAAFAHLSCPKAKHICDAGCGMGFISKELSRYNRDAQIDAIDMSSAATQYIRRTLTKEQAKRIVSMEGDYTRLSSDAVYDLMVFSLSTTINDAWQIALEHCTDTLIVVNKINTVMKSIDFDTLTSPRQSLALSDEGIKGTPGKVKPRPRINDFASTIENFRSRGFVCESHEIVFDYGQPFRSLTDAQTYFGLFRNRTYSEGITETELQKVLTVTGEEEFPYYLPITRHVGVVAIDVPKTKAAMRALAV